MICTLIYYYITIFICNMGFLVNAVDVVAVDQDTQENQPDVHIMRPDNVTNVKFGIRHER